MVLFVVKINEAFSISCFIFLCLALVCTYISKCNRNHMILE